MLLDPRMAAADAAGVGSQPGSRKSSTFAKTNLHAWAYEEYDAVKRTPEERAQVLKDLGITRAGFIARNPTRVSEFESYALAYKQHGIELVAAWTPIHTDAALEEPHIRTFLDVIDRHKMKIQWWLTLEDLDKVPEAERMGKATTQLRPLVAAASQRGCPLVLYGHGRDHWFTQIENQITIIERLSREIPLTRLGIVYNFHQSHSQMDRLKDVFPKMKPYLAALNLDGMRAEGPQIITLGQGNREKGMIQIIRESGWHGPVGIIGHQRTEDVKVTLQKNLVGLRAILQEIGDDAGAASF